MPANLPYPMQFDPSQMKNPYTKWAGVEMPFYGAAPSPAGLFGGTAPTNGLGQPIQSYTDANAAAQADYAAQQAAYQKALGAYNAGVASGGATPGTTLNNTGGSQGAGIGSGGQVPGGTIDYAKMGDAGPAVQELLSNYQAAQAKLTPQQQYNQEQIRMGNANTMQQEAFQSAGMAGSGFGRSPGGAFNPGSDFSPSMLMQGGGGSGAPARPAPPQAPQQPNMTAAYIAALQKPGYVTSPGATVAQGPPPSQQSNVLQQFLASSRGGTGAGNYDNRGFFGGLIGNV